MAAPVVITDYPGWLIADCYDGEPVADLDFIADQKRRAREALADGRNTVFPASRRAHLAAAAVYRRSAYRAEARQAVKAMLAASVAELEGAA